MSEEIHEFELVKLNCAHAFGIHIVLLFAKFISGDERTSAGPLF